MNKKLWEHRIPTIPALILVVISLYFTLGLLKNNVFTRTNANADTEPNNVTIGNITDTSFTVGFTTNVNTVAQISINKPDGQEILIYDNRETKTVGQLSTLSHIFTVKNLSANTKYFFTILVNGKLYSNQGSQYTVTTGMTLSATPYSYASLKGFVIGQNNTKAADTLIVVKPQGGQTLLGITDNTGSYSIPINQVRTEQLNQFLMISKTTQMSLQALQTTNSSTITMSYPQNGAVPPVTLTENYSFSPPTPSSESAYSIFSLPTPAEVNKGKISITVPVNNQSFIDTQPLFQGTALPNQKVSISIHTTPLTAEVLTDAHGNWSFRPNFPLSPGQHTISIQTMNALGFQQTVTSSFSIFPSGSQVIQSATPSATPTFTPTPTPTTAPTATPTQMVTPTPTQTITASPTPTPTSTPIPTIQQATPTSSTFISVTPSKAGSGAVVMVTLVSVICIIAGTTLLFIVA